MLYFLMEDYSFEVPYPRELMFRQNLYAVICQIRQFSKLGNLPSLFEKIFLQILDLKESRKSLTFSTNSFHRESIKTSEKLQYGC